MKDLIINNPYRILGVYVGDSPAAEQKNLGRFRAFEKVGQTYEITLSGEEDLPKIMRTEKSAAEASQQLSLPTDRIRYSLLWFSDGKTDWGRTLNAAVSALIRDDYRRAIIEYNKLLTSDALRDEYVAAVTHGLGTQTKVELIEILSKYFHDDKGYKEFLFNAETIPSCYLSQEIFRDHLQQRSEKSAKDLELKVEEAKGSSNFYKTIEEIKNIYQQILKEITICRNVFGVDSIEYQEYAVLVAKSAYKVSSELVRRIGVFVWNPTFRDLNGEYEKYDSKLPRRAIDECMRLIKEVEYELDNFIFSLRLSRKSQIILFSEKIHFQKVLDREYVDDTKVLGRSNLRAFLVRAVTLAAWLTVLLAIIFSNLK